MCKYLQLIGILTTLTCALNCILFIGCKNFNKTNQITTPYRFLENYSVKNLPLTDSTNFINFNNSTVLTMEQCRLLKLDKIESLKDVIFRINYRLDISPNFQSIVVSYYPNEQELFTILINYTNSYDIIDFITIAYDEIAESSLNSKSLISTGRIEVFQKDESSGRVEMKTTKFEMKEDGQIVLGNVK